MPRKGGTHGKPDAFYVEVMCGMTNLIRCAVCGKLVRWPEEIRAYARSLSDTPHRWEHVTHPVLPNCQRLEPE